MIGTINSAHAFGLLGCLEEFDCVLTCSPDRPGRVQGHGSREPFDASAFHDERCSDKTARLLIQRSRRTGGGELTDLEDPCAAIFWNVIPDLAGKRDLEAVAIADIVPRSHAGNLIKATWPVRSLLQADGVGGRLTEAIGEHAGFEFGEADAQHNGRLGTCDAKHDSNIGDSVCGAAENGQVVDAERVASGLQPVEQEIGDEDAALARIGLHAVHAADGIRAARAAA